MLDSKKKKIMTYNIILMCEINYFVHGNNTSYLHKKITLYYFTQMTGIAQFRICSHIFLVDPLEPPCGGVTHLQHPSYHRTSASWQFLNIEGGLAGGRRVGPGYNRL